MPQQDSKVREATEDDILSLLFLAKEFHNETPKHYDWEPKKVESRIKWLIEDPNGCVLVLESDGEIKGAILFMVSESLFSSKLTATELAWFVSKDFRGKASSLKLVKEYERMCKEAGVTTLLMSDIPGIQDLGKLYNRLGYSKIETAYLKEL